MARPKKAITPAQVTTWERIPVIFDLSFAACLIRMDQENLRKIARSGGFPAFKVGTKWRVRKTDLSEWIDCQLSQSRIANRPTKEDTT